MSFVLCDHLPLLATAPDGIQKLRGLILELAMRGKLVPQDPSNEPASQLLERIAEERSRLAAEGKIKKPKTILSVREDESPYVLPDSWVWVRLSDVTTKITDGTHHSPPNLPVGQFKYISAKNIKPWGIDESAMTFVTKEIHDEIFARCNPEFGDVLYIKDGATTGVAAINSLTEPFSMLSSVALLKPSVGLFNRYLYFLMSSPIFYAEMRAGMTGVAITRVTLAKLNAAVLPLPPIAEQHCIVAKVDELMALCDRLEAEQVNAESAQNTLVETLLGMLTQSTCASEFVANWQRLAEHFDTLFTSESGIHSLKQTILRLAVMGKLVPQDPDDEPTKMLLKRIEQEGLEAGGAYKKLKLLPLVTEDEQRFTLPGAWDWVRFGSIADTRLGKMLDAAKNRGELKPYLRNTNVQWWRFNLDDIKEMRLAEDELHEFRLADGDLLICEGGEPGRCSIWRSEVSEMYFQKALHRARPLGGCVPEYLQIVLRQDAVSGALNSYFTGATIKHFTGEKLNSYVIPLPPVAEQHRIVAKVNEMIGFCDRLKAAFAESRSRQERLASTLIESALKAA